MSSSREKALLPPQILATEDQETNTTYCIFSKNFNNDTDFIQQRIYGLTFGLTVGFFSY